MSRNSFVLGALLFVMFSLQLSEGNTVKENDKNEIMEKLAQRVPAVENFKLPGIKEKCTNKGDLWECCIGIESHLNFTACLSIAYLEDEVGFEVKVTVDGLVLFSEKMSLKNPPPICFHVPYLEKIANACFRFYNLDDKNQTITGCVDFEGHVEGFRVFKFDLGCFTIPLLFLEKDVKYGVKIMEQTFG